MRILNRLVTFFVLSLALLCLIALALAPQSVIAFVQRNLLTFSNFLVGYQASDPLNFNIARVAVVIGALVVLLPLLLAEFPRRKTEPVVRLHTASGEAQVTADSIARRLAWHLDQLADVISVQPVVTPRGDHVDVLLIVETSPAIEVPMKTEEVMLVAREVVQDRMGLKLGRLEVRIQHADFPPLAA